MYPKPCIHSKTQRAMIVRQFYESRRENEMGEIWTNLLQLWQVVSRWVGTRLGLVDFSSPLAVIAISPLKSEQYHPSLGKNA